jgi:transcription termination/antitermination protein NusG
MRDAKLEPAWYVLHTRSHFENVVHGSLGGKAKETFLPKMRVRSRRKDRVKMIDLPVFPGYVFVRTSLLPAEHVDILKIPGAVRLIGNSAGPVSVPDATIESLRIMTAVPESVFAGTRFEKGDRVMVIAGPFAGVVGFFSRYRGQERVVVEIEILGRFAAVEVAEEEVEPLPEIMT